jgi:hypothetical protein
MTGTVWSKSRGGKVAVRNTMLRAEFSVALGELTMLDFSPRDDHHLGVAGAEPITGERAQEIARVVLDSQVGAEWRWADPLMASVGDVAASYFYRLYWNELPYDMSRARINLDRYSGCVTFLSKSFTSLPTLAPGYDTGVSEEVKVMLRAEALQAYSRWRPMEEATLGHMEVAYHVPSFADLDNELTESHLQIAARKEMIPLFRVSLRGTRAGRPFLVNIYVDAKTKKSIAIKEDDLSNLPGLGTSTALVEPLSADGLRFISGTALKCESASEVEEDLASDASLVICTTSESVLLVQVDISQRVLWQRSGTGSVLRSWRVSADTWKIVERELSRNKQRFGLSGLIEQADPWVHRRRGRHDGFGRAW